MKMFFVQSASQSNVRRTFAALCVMMLTGSIAVQGQEPASNAMASQPKDGSSMTEVLPEADQYVSKTNTKRMFIPDGGGDSLVSSIEFGEFGTDVVVTPEQVASVCINMEHSSQHDIRIELLCPSYDPSRSATAGRAVLKYGGVGDAPSFLGCPLDQYMGDGVYDGYPSYDSLQNPYGVGLEYCWSVNHVWTLVSGDSAHSPVDANAALLRNAPSYELERPVEHTIPARFFYYGPSVVVLDGPTAQPSDRYERSNYYLPEDQFENLVGCPLSGIWSIKITDFWGADNGWVFGWTLDLYSLRQEGIELPTSDFSTQMMPNPATDRVKVSSDKGLRQIDIYDLQGKLVRSEALNGNETDVNISGLKSGIYCARILTNEGRTARKLVVQ